MKPEQAFRKATAEDIDRIAEHGTILLAALQHAAVNLPPTADKGNALAFAAACLIHSDHAQRFIESFKVCSLALHSDDGPVVGGSEAT